ncbi:hypothetical protein ACOMHN_062553 [Nucella lapillus]
MPPKRATAAAMTARESKESGTPTRKQYSPATQQLSGWIKGKIGVTREEESEDMHTQFFAKGTQMVLTGDALSRFVLEAVRIAEEKEERKQERELRTEEMRRQEELRREEMRRQEEKEGRQEVLRKEEMRRQEEKEGRQEELRREEMRMHKELRKEEMKRREEWKQQEPRMSHSLRGWPQ